jgi:pilus assembly protein CpaB
MKRRVLAIALAVVLAVLGTGGVLAYVNHANARALAGQQAVTVLVARQVIPAGTTAADAQAQGLLGTERMPASSVPADALATISPDLSGLVMDAAVQPGQLLLRTMLVTKAQNSNGLTIPHGMFALAIQFCVPEAVAGNLHSGSQVAVFQTIADGNANVTAQAACAGPHSFTPAQNFRTSLVLPNVKVLAVGQAANVQSGSSSTSNSGSGQPNVGLVTLAVSQADAVKLIQISENGLPYLALLAS